MTSNEDMVKSLLKTSFHEEIIREVEETDWTVDPTEEEEMSSTTTAIEASVNTIEESSAVEDDEDFDVNELECVDETIEEERGVREHCKDKGRRSEEKKSHRSDSREKHRPERRHSYSRRDYAERRYHHVIPASYRKTSRDNFGLRPRHSRSGRSAPYEKFSREHVRDMSRDRKSKEMSRGEGDVPLDELELEEVDCCDDLGDDGSEYIDGASQTGELCAREDDDLEDANSVARLYGESVVDDEFPDLCEEIDVDAMRRAAASTSIVLSDDERETPEVDSSLFLGTTTLVAESSSRGVAKISRNGGSSTRSRRETVYDDRRDEARRRRHHVDRDEYRSFQGSRTLHSNSRQGLDRYREKRALSGKYKLSTSADLIVDSESVKRDDSEIISVEGPLARGWCAVEDDEVTSSSPKVRPRSKAATYDESTARGNIEKTSGHSSKRKLEAHDRGDVDGPTKPSKVRSSPPRHHLDKDPSAESPKRTDLMLTREYEARKSKHDVKSPPAAMTSDHLRHKNGIAIGNTEKIPSLLDICLNGLPPRLSSASTSHDAASVEQLQVNNGGKQKLNCHDIDSCSGVKSKALSLLDMDIPPPNRDEMRRYAIMLNGLELTKRQSFMRPGMARKETWSRIQQKSPPRRHEQRDYSRQPRAYIHGIRK